MKKPPIPQPRVLFSLLNAPSVHNQAELIRRLIKQKGFEVKYQSTISLYDIKNPVNHAFLWFKLALVEILGETVYAYLGCDKPKAVYVTVEGIPTKANILCSNLPRLDLIANSHFTAKCLREAGLNVIDVVHHAIDLEEAKKAAVEGKQLRKRLKQHYGDKVFYLFVGRFDPRKALATLSKAWDMLREDIRKDIILFLQSDKEAKSVLPQDNVILLNTTGALKFNQVLSLYHAIDYTIFPTMCEGFGLPLLESNACGKPVIHAWIPPLNEFSSQKFNFVFDYVDVKLVRCGMSQYWMMHEYPPEYLADMVEYSYRVYRDKPEEYANYCQMALEYVKKWDYKRIYPRLLKYLGIS